MIDLNADIFMVRSRLKIIIGDMDGVIGCSVSERTVTIFVNAEASLSKIPKKIEGHEVIIIPIATRVL